MKAMQHEERRQSPRHNPVGIRATISLDSTAHPMSLEGEVVDISQSGLKIRLDTPCAADLSGKIKIQLTLPNSGIPLTISGVLKHKSPANELGLQYVDNEKAVEMDNFMIEVIKLAKV
jgi:PilZ domain